MPLGNDKERFFSLSNLMVTPTTINPTHLLPCKESRKIYQLSIFNVLNVNDNSVSNKSPLVANDKYSTEQQS